MFLPALYEPRDEGPARKSYSRDKRYCEQRQTDREEKVLEPGERFGQEYLQECVE